MREENWIKENMIGNNQTIKEMCIDCKTPIPFEDLYCEEHKKDHPQEDFECTKSVYFKRYYEKSKKEKH